MDQVNMMQINLEARSSSPISQEYFQIWTLVSDICVRLQLRKNRKLKKLYHSTQL